jgi:HAD superfamily hydrolase (TIGR01549 family)
MPIRAVFFDAGETLIDETRMWQGWANYLGVPWRDFSAAFDAVIAEGRHHRETFERLQPGFNFAHALAERDRLGTAYRYERRDLYPDAATCLSALSRQGLFVGIAGNQPEQAQVDLEALGFDVDLIATSAKLGAEKPAGEFYRRLLAAAGFEATESLYVGDRVDNDVLPARAHGMKTAFLQRGPWGRHHAGLPGAALADLWLESLAELPQQLAKLRGD